jgi:hypothetical protein
MVTNLPHEIVEGDDRSGYIQWWIQAVSHKVGERVRVLGERSIDTLPVIGRFLLVNRGT